MRTSSSILLSTFVLILGCGEIRHPENATVRQKVEQVQGQSQQISSEIVAAQRRLYLENYSIRQELGRKGTAADVDHAVNMDPRIMRIRAEIEQLQKDLAWVEHRTDELVEPLEAIESASPESPTIESPEWKVFDKFRKQRSTKRE